MNEIYDEIRIFSIISEFDNGEICNIPLKLPQKMNDKKTRASKKNFFKCLREKGFKFSDDLMYPQRHCPKIMNNSKLEPYIQKLSENNEKIYDEFKKLSAKGIYGPYEIINDDKQGYVVKTLDVILTNTIICEYSGDVFFLKNKIFEENDSIMELITCPNPILSMVICPKKYGNLGMF